MRCNAPAIRSLMADGTYDKRYSCPPAQVIAGASMSRASGARPEA